MENYKNADLGKRIIATLLDGMFQWLLFALCIIILICIGVIVKMLLSQTDVEDQFIFSFSILYVIFSLVFTWFYTFVRYPVKSGGFTPGKKVLKIKIVKTDGTDVTYMSMFMRRFVYEVTVGVFLPLILVVFSNKYQQGLHDLAAGTRVVEAE